MAKKRSNYEQGKLSDWADDNRKDEMKTQTADENRKWVGCGMIGWMNGAKKEIIVDKRSKKYWMITIACSIDLSIGS